MVKQMGRTKLAGTVEMRILDFHIMGTAEIYFTKVGSCLVGS